MTHLSCFLACASCGRASTLPPDKPRAPVAEHSAWDMGSVSALSLSGDDTIALQHAIAPTLDGQNTVVVWKELGPGETQPRYSFAVVGRDGTVHLYRPGVTHLARGLEGSLLWVTATVEGYVFYYDDYDTIYSVWLDHAGVVRNEGRLRDSYSYRERRMVRAGTGHAIVYRYANGGNYYTTLQRLGSDGRRYGDAYRVDDTAAINQYQPDATWVGDGFLVVWHLYGSPYQIYITRTDETGVARAPAVPLYPSSSGQTSPLIWSDGAGRHLVRWRESYRTWFLLVDDDGVPQWAEPSELEDTNRVESFTFEIAGGHGFEMVWESDIESVFPRIVTASLPLTPIDLPLAPEQFLSDSAFPCYHPSTALTVGNLAVGFRCPAAGAWRVFLVQENR